MTVHVGTWQAILDADDRPAAVRAHLAAALARDEEDQRLLDDLMAHFRDVRVDRDELAVDFTVGDDDVCELRCSAPYTGPTEGIPPTVLAVISVHNGLGMESPGGGAVAINGYHDDGTPAGGGFEHDHLDDVDSDDPFLVAIDAAGWANDDVVAPMDDEQDWFLWHPTERNAHGEPMLYFFSHEGGGPERMDWAEKLTLGQVLLRRTVDLLRAASGD